MKHFLLTIIFLCSFLASEALVRPVNDSKKCRLEVTDKDTSKKTLKKVIEIDLMSKVWTLSQRTGKRYFEFHSYGTVDIINENNQGEVSSDSFIWEVETTDAEAFLVITNMVSGKIRKYSVAQNCEGIDLVSDGIHLFLSHGLTL